MSDQQTRGVYALRSDPDWMVFDFQGFDLMPRHGVRDLRPSRDGRVRH